MNGKARRVGHRAKDSLCSTSPRDGGHLARGSSATIAMDRA